MEWEKLKQHVENWKKGESLNKQQKRDYQQKTNVPVWQKVKNYSPTVVNHIMLQKNINSPETAIDVAIQDLMAGKTITLMG